MATARAPASLYLLAAVSVAIGIGVHLVAIHHGPHGELAQSSLLSPMQLRQHVGLRNLHAASAQSVFGWKSQLTSWGKAWDGFINFGFIVIIFFKHLLSTQLGKGLLLGVLSSMLPIAQLMINEALKPHRNVFTGIVVVVGILFLGQAICIGAATPIVFVPLYIFRRVSEARTVPTGIHPLPAPPRPVLTFNLFLHGLVVSVCLATTFIPPNSKHWLSANLAFQFFPFAYLPLVAWPIFQRIMGFKADARTSRRAAKGGSNGSTKVARRPNRDLVDLYQMTSLLSLGFQLWSILLVYPYISNILRAFTTSLRAIPSTLLRGHSGAFLQLIHAAAKKQANLANDGEWLLLFDNLGLMLSGYLIILTDQILDDWIVTSKANVQEAPATGGARVKAARTQSHVKRVHAQRFLLEDVFMGLPLVIVLGPGFGLARYLQRRETLAEKARFEEASNVRQNIK